MYAYSLGLLAGTEIQQALTLQAGSLALAQDLWAAHHKVLHTSDWDHEHKTCRGFPVVCFETTDPAVEVFRPAAPGAASASPQQEPPPEPDQGDSIILVPPKDVPEFSFRQDWKDEEQAGAKRPSGFDEDKPI